MPQTLNRTESARPTPVRELIGGCAEPRDRAATDRAWEELVSRYGRTLGAAVCRALARGGAEARGVEADDVVQEVYCRLLADGRRRLVGFRGGADRELRTWLRRVATRTTYDHLRARRRRRRSLARRREALEATAAAGAPSPAGEPELRLVARQERRRYLRRVRAACGSARDARILALVVFAGWTSREVAEASGGRLTASGVDSLIYRVRRRLAADGLDLPER